MELKPFEIIGTLRQKELEHLAKETEYYELKHKKAQLEKEKALIEEGYSSKIAFDKELKNAEQRKAKLYQLLQQDSRYQELIKLIEALEEELHQVIVELKKTKIEAHYYQNLLETMIAILKAPSTEILGITQEN